MGFISTILISFGIGAVITGALVWYSYTNDRKREKREIARNRVTPRVSDND